MYYITISDKGSINIVNSTETRIVIFMPPPLDTGGIMFSGCPSVRPSEAWNTLFWPVHWSVGPPDQPLSVYGMSVCPSVCLSVRPSGEVPGICRRMHGGISLKFCMLMYLDHLQNWLVYGHGLLIFLILALFWLSETGQIWVSGHFPKKAFREWPEILHADVSWPPSELIGLWPQSVDSSNFGAILT